MLRVNYFVFSVLSGVFWCVVYTKISGFGGN